MNINRIMHHSFSRHDYPSYALTIKPRYVPMAVFRVSTLVLLLLPSHGYGRSV